MPASRRGAALVALITLIACLVPAAPQARADELVVMPYACTAAGGRVLLTPGPERGHRIIGRREQRRFTACSAANPDICRQWTVYRFDLDCDGERVPWVEVVAAAGEAGRRAWLADGRLQLRMAPRWNLAPDDPCAYEPDRDTPFADRRRRRYCAERLASAPPPVVEMPLGFAPMLGLDAIFVKAAPGIAKALPPVGDDPIGADQAQPEPPPARPAGEGFAKPTPPASTPPPPSPQSPGEAHAKVLSPPEAMPAPKAAPPPPAPPTAEGPKSPAPTPAPKAVAAPPPAKETAPPRQVAQPPPSRTPPQPDAKPAAKVAVAPPALPAPAETAEPEDRAAGPSLFSVGVLRTTTAGVVVAFTGLTLGLLIAFAVARRRERLHHAAAIRQHAKGPPRLDYDDGSEPAGLPAWAPSRVRRPSAADAALEAWGDRMPRTRMEALKVLGIGAAPGADAAALKRIVDALRVNWHPDRARDEPDRQLRELRSKQINAAWELLQGERAEP
jgi:hypothetical protein